MWAVMQALLPRLRDAEVWVWATPLYCEGLPGPKKTVIDRMLPLLEPSMELRNGHCAVQVRTDGKLGKVVLVASCGFWEVDNFDRMVAHVRALCARVGREYVGALLRPHASFYSAMLNAGAPVGDVVEAAREAGRQLVREGRFDPGTLQTVGRALLPVEAFVATANQGVQQALEVLNNP
jgi:multimeric flavodoxin WrbA